MKEESAFDASFGIVQDPAYELSGGFIIFQRFQDTLVVIFNRNTALFVIGPVRGLSFSTYVEALFALGTSLELLAIWQVSFLDKGPVADPVVIIQVRLISHNKDTDGSSVRA